jgi:uncharacterized protein YoxC
MDFKEIFELLIISVEKFGVVVTLVMFSLVALVFYLMKNKSKTEKTLTTILDEMNKANSENVQMTANNIQEIKNSTIDVLEKMNQLNGEIRGIVDIIKFLISDYHSRQTDGNDGGDK